MKTAIKLDIPKVRVRSILFHYYMSNLPEEYHPADHLSCPQEDLLMTQQLFEGDDVNKSGVYQHLAPRPPADINCKTVPERQKLRRIEANATSRVDLTRWVMNYLRNFWQFPSITFSHS